MKTLLTLTVGVLLTLLQAGCSSSAEISAGHHGHEHGVSVAGHANHSGIGAGASAQ